MDQTLRSEIIGTAGLSLTAFVALILTWQRPLLHAEHTSEWRRTVRVFILGLLLQTAHVVEEAMTGFHRRYPALFDLTPWPLSFFLILNLGWLAIWSWAASALRVSSRLALFAAWFFSLAAMANGLAHPLMAFVVGGYFPGLVTAPLVGAVGLWLCMRLVTITRPQPISPLWRKFGLFVETIVFSIIVPGAVTYWIPKEVLGLFDNALPNRWTLWQFVAIVPLMLGLAIYLACLWEFAARGRGIPAPIDHPKQLVITGLYRYVRNPMYVGVLVFLIGESVFLVSWPYLLYTLAWLLFVHLNVILYEEPNLRCKFGESYDRYKSAVRRWIPGNRYSEQALEPTSPNSR